MICVEKNRNCYSAEISRNNPALIGFLIDQSGSMAGEMAGSGGRLKQDICAEYIDSFFTRLLSTNSSGETLKDRFNIFVLGYGRDNPPSVESALDGISIDEMPIGLERLKKSAKTDTREKKIVRKEPDNAGGFIEREKTLQVTILKWITPISDGITPMNEGFRSAFEITSKWIQDHPKSYPPIIINITDGQFNTEDPEPIAREIMELHTDDGNVLLFNIHITDESNGSNALPSLFPDRKDFPPDPDAQKLFVMSSNLVTSMIQYARSKDKQISDNAVGFGFNADFSDFIDFLDIGTRPAAG